MDLNVSVLGAFLPAACLSFFSPCVLPLVPPYLCFLAGVSFDEFSNQESNVTGSVFRTALAFVAGFTTVFVMLGATASVLGQALTRHLDTLADVAGIVIVTDGAALSRAVSRISWLLCDQARRTSSESRPVFLAATLSGLAFAFGWTPCVGPVLAAILFLAASNDTAWQGAALLLVYSLGIGLPFLAACALCQARSWNLMSRAKRHMLTIERTMGGLLVVTGLLFHDRSDVERWPISCSNAFPALGADRIRQSLNRERTMDALSHCTAIYWHVRHDERPRGQSGRGRSAQAAVVHRSHSRMSKKTLRPPNPKASDWRSLSNSAAASTARSCTRPSSRGRRWQSTSPTISLSFSTICLAMKKSSTPMARR